MTQTNILNDIAPLLTAYNDDSANIICCFHDYHTTLQTKNGEPVYIAATLEYDFAESNYEIITKNLIEVSDFNLGPTRAKAYRKQFPNEVAYMIVVRDSEEADIYSCL